MSEDDWYVQRVVVDDSVIDARDPFSIIDPLWWTGNIYDGVEEYDSSLSSFSREQRLIFAAIWYISEVNNGGHDQFFFNSTGIVWPDAVEAFRELGLRDVVAVLQESGKRLGGEPSRIRDDRIQQLEDTKANFEDLDDQFYDLDNTHDFNSVIADYIQSNRDSFYFDGPVRVPKQQ